MQVEINWLAIVAAVVASQVIGFIWYAKPVFGKQWQALTGMTDKKAEVGMAMAMAQMVVYSVLTAFVLFHMIAISQSYYQTTDITGALECAFWLWLGMSLPALALHDAFEQRDIKLTMINTGNRLVTLLAMATAIYLITQ